MLRKLRERIQSEEKGFTLIELLVVILIIGILAAIAIPSFLSQTEKAEDAEAKAAARNAQTAAETYYTDNQGSYTGLTTAELVAAEETLNEFMPSNLAVTNVTADTYTITVTSDNAHTFSVTRAANGVITRGGSEGSW